LRLAVDSTIRAIEAESEMELQGSRSLAEDLKGGGASARHQK